MPQPPAVDFGGTLDTPDEEPAAPTLGACLPVFGLSLDPLLRDIERSALRLTNNPQAPSSTDILHLFQQLPRSRLRRGSDRSMYIVCGANSRCTNSVLTQCVDTPYFCMAVNRFIRSWSPMHPYSTWTLKQGCRDTLHRDTRNGPTDSWLMCLTPCEPEEGLWIADHIGGVYKRHRGEELAGSVLNLCQPVTFPARRNLHAGHVSDPSRAQSRVVLIAFSTLNAATVSPQVRQQLVDLGFHVPSRALLREATHGPGSGDEPRLKQLTLEEALHLPQDRKDKQDVIEVLVSQRD